MSGPPALNSDQAETTRSELTGRRMVSTHRALPRLQTVFNREEYLMRLNQKHGWFPSRAGPLVTQQKFVRPPKYEVTHQKPFPTVQVTRTGNAGNEVEDRKRRQFNIYDLKRDGRTRSDGLVVDTHATGEIATARQTAYEAIRENFRLKKAREELEARDVRRVNNNVEITFAQRSSQFPSINRAPKAPDTNQLWQQRLIGPQNVNINGGVESFYADAGDQNVHSRQRLLGKQQKTMHTNQEQFALQTRPQMVQHPFPQRERQGDYAYAHGAGLNSQSPFDHIQEWVQRNRQGSDVIDVLNRKQYPDTRDFEVDPLSYVTRANAPQIPKFRNLRPGPGYQASWAVPANQATHLGPYQERVIRNKFDKTVPEREKFEAKAQWEKIYQGHLDSQRDNSSSIIAQSQQQKDPITPSYQILPARGQVQQWHLHDPNTPGLAPLPEQRQAQPEEPQEQLLVQQ